MPSTEDLEKGEEKVERKKKRRGEEKVSRRKRDRHNFYASESYTVIEYSHSIDSVPPLTDLG